MANALVKILIVDSGQKNVELLEAILLPRGYAVIRASNGEKALHDAHKESPDLVLVDVTEAASNGLNLCKRLKGDDKTRLIPVIVMTALGAIEDRIKGIEAGADDFLTKPINRDELLARIQTLLRGLKISIDERE